MERLGRGQIDLFASHNFLIQVANSINASMNKALAVKQKTKHDHIGLKQSYIFALRCNRLQFGDKNTVDIKLHLTYQYGTEYQQNLLYLHFEVVGKSEFYESMFFV
jgi:hypothetical protein